jgi:hypothetical protein
MVTQLLIRRHRNGPRISVGGNVDAESASAFGAVLRRDVRTMALQGGALELDLVDLELDGSAVPEAVNALRELLREFRVVVRHAPSMLAQRLVRAGLLDDGRLQLEAPRA